MSAGNVVVGSVTSYFSDPRVYEAVVTAPPANPFRWAVARRINRAAGYDPYDTAGTMAGLRFSPVLDFESADS